MNEETKPVEENQEDKPLILEEIFPKPDTKDPFATPLIHPSVKTKRRNRNKVQKASRKANR